MPLSSALSKESITSLYTHPNDYTKFFNELSKKCELTVNSISLNDDGIPFVVVDINGMVQNNQNYVILFGEHARELVSTEFGLNYATHLCENQAKLSGNYRLFIDANPVSRARVMQGDFCLRTNPNGVDLNRNWRQGFKRAPAEIMPGHDTYPGDRAESEMEVRMIRQMAYNQNTLPDVFLSVHSGNWVLGYNGPPPAPKPDATSDTDGDAEAVVIRRSGRSEPEDPFALEKELLDSMSREVSSRCARTSTCAMHNPEGLRTGALSDALTYSPAGTCVDVAKHEKRVPIVLAAEIYRGRQDDELLKGLSKSWPLSCLRNFTPVSRAQLKDTFNLWTPLLDRIFAYSADLINQKRIGGSRPTLGSFRASEIEQREQDHKTPQQALPGKIQTQEIGRHGWSKHAFEEEDDVDSDDDSRRRI